MTSPVLTIARRLGDSLPMPGEKAAVATMAALAVGSVIGYGEASRPGQFDNPAVIAAKSDQAAGQSSPNSTNQVVISSAGVEAAQPTDADGKAVESPKAEVVSDFPIEDGPAVDNNGQPVIPGYDSSSVPAPQVGGDAGPGAEPAVQANGQPNLDPSQMYGNQQPGNNQP